MGLGRGCRGFPASWGPPPPPSETPEITPAVTMIDDDCLIVINIIGDEYDDVYSDCHHDDHDVDHDDLSCR